LGRIRANLFFREVIAEDRSEVEAIMPLLSTHAIKVNLPTHHFDCYQPHQGVYLLRELVMPTYVFG